MASTTSNPTSGASTPTTATAAQEQHKVLEEALNVVKVQAFHMKRCLEVEGGGNGKRTFEGVGEECCMGLVGGE
ncbi:hypothetical protein HDU67_000290 [Dinochytrium kinnereticum]|nr:hypothetical protein HDU67_000290 [Dinochytrium kinnereticum]